MSLEQFKLTNKTILITGASSGIGRETAVILNQAGANVIITGRNKERLEETFRMLKRGDNKMIVADLLNDADIEIIAKETLSLNGVVHSAGIVEPFPVKYINRKKIDETFAINYYAPMLLMTTLFKNKKISKNLSAVFMSSFSSHSPYPSGALYTGSKAALENYCKVLASEHAFSGLRANCVAPALVKTPIFDKTFNDNIQEINPLRTSIEEYEKYYLHGFGEVSDVANLIFFLISDASRWITGQTIIIDGGYGLGLQSKVLKM